MDKVTAPSVSLMNVHFLLGVKINPVPNFNHLVCILHRLAESIWPYKMDQINADPRKLILTRMKEDLSANSTWIRGLKCNWTKEV
jgi:hypothetical protein